MSRTFPWRCGATPCRRVWMTGAANGMLEASFGQSRENGHLTGTLNGPQPYATVSAATRRRPDILCWFPETANDNPYGAGHASGDCPLRMVPQSRESLGGRK